MGFAALLCRVLASPLGEARSTYAAFGGSGVRTERWGTMLAARFPTSQTLRPPWLGCYEKFYARVARSVCTTEARGIASLAAWFCVSLRTAIASLADVRKDVLLLVGAVVVILRHSHYLDGYITCRGRRPRRPVRRLYRRDLLRRYFR